MIFAHIGKPAASAAFHVAVCKPQGSGMTDRASQHDPDFTKAQTGAVRRALANARDHTALADLLFLERWEMAPVPGAAAALRVSQIRRANPGLTAAIRAEIALARAGGRPA
jgi:hypothetical protein